MALTTDSLQPRERLKLLPDDASYKFTRTMYPRDKLRCATKDKELKLDLKKDIALIKKFLQNRRDRLRIIYDDILEDYHLTINQNCLKLY